MKLHSPATPMLILVGLTLVFLGATIDLLGNTLCHSYKLLEPILCQLWVFTLEALSCWLQTHFVRMSLTLQSTGARLEQYFYRVDNSSGSIPSILDAFYCTALVDLGRLMKHTGEAIRKAFE